MMPPSRRATLERTLLWLLPILVCLAAFYPAFQVWFLRDDFRWLGLRRLMAESPDPIATMLAPYAQGTIRVLSERVFFVGLSSLFDLNAVPFRIVVFLTQFANLALVLRLGLRITGSRIAACIAACLWALSPRIAVPMYWTSAYNQILCAFFVLSALVCLDLYVVTVKRKWLMAQYAAFILSFGALEIGVVYPAIATFWIWMFARDRWLTTIPLWLGSLVFASAQLLLIPRTASPTYQLSFNSSVFTNFCKYFVWTLGPSRIGYMIDESLREYGYIAAGLLLAALVVFAIRQRSLAVGFCFLWFGAFLAPVLPLTNHVSDYYLAIPVIGICWLLGWTLQDLWSRATAFKVAAVFLASTFVVGSVWEDRETVTYYADRTRRMKRLVNAVQAAHTAAPAKSILLGGIDEELFSAGFADEPFYAAGAAVSANQPLVFLVPGAEAGLQKQAELRSEQPALSRYVISADRAARVLEQNQAVVLQTAAGSVRDATAVYRAIVQSQRDAMRRNQIELGDPASADLLGPGWHPPEKGFRWMSGKAAVRIASPQTASERLHIEGYVPAAAVSGGPVTLTVKANGATIGTSRISQPNSLLTADFELPASLRIPREMNVELEVSRTFRPSGDPRDLGLIISKVSVR